MSGSQRGKKQKRQRGKGIGPFQPLDVTSVGEEGLATMKGDETTMAAHLFDDISMITGSSDEHRYLEDRLLTPATCV